MFERIKADLVDVVFMRLVAAGPSGMNRTDVEGIVNAVLATLIDGLPGGDAATYLLVRVRGAVPLWPSPPSSSSEAVARGD